MLEADGAADEYALGRARDARQRRHAVARRGRGMKALAACSYHWAWCHGGPIARSSWCGRVRGTGAAERCVGGGMGRSSPGVAFVRFWVADRIGRWSVLVFGAKWFFDAGRLEELRKPGLSCGAGPQGPARDLLNKAGCDGGRAGPHGSSPSCPGSIARLPTSDLGGTAAQREAPASLRGCPPTQACAAGRVIPPPSQSTWDATRRCMGG